MNNMAKEKEYKIYKPTEQEIQTLEKFSIISDKMYIEPDRISVIDGKPDNKGDANNIKKLAVFNIEKPHNFENKIGFVSISQFLSVISSIKNYEIRIYDKYVLVIDLTNNFKIQMFLTPEDAYMIPYTDVLGKFERAYANPNVTRFSVDWSIIKNCVMYQQLLNKKNLFFYSKNNDSISIKIADMFDSDSSNMAEIDIDSNIAMNESPLFKNGGFMKIELNIKTLIEDTYEVTILEKAILLSGAKHGTKYMILAQLK